MTILRKQIEQIKNIYVDFRIKCEKSFFQAMLELQEYFQTIPRVEIHRISSLKSYFDLIFGPRTIFCLLVLHLSGGMALDGRLWSF